MARGRKPKGPKTLWDKVKEFDENFAIGIQTMTTDQLKAELVKIANEEQKNDDAKAKDTDLAALREQLKTANETYTIPGKQYRMKRKLVVDYLRSKGQLSAE